MLVGFVVLPRVTGNQVTLQIQLRQDILTQQPGVVNVQHISSTLSGRLGEWISLGEITQEQTGQSRGLVSSGKFDRTDQHGVWLKVQKYASAACPSCVARANAFTAIETGCHLPLCLPLVPPSPGALHQFSQKGRASTSNDQVERCWPVRRNTVSIKHQKYFSYRASITRIPMWSTCVISIILVPLV